MDNQVNTIGGMSLLVYTLVAAAYWVDAVRCAETAHAYLVAGNKRGEARAKRSLGWARRIFRICTGLMLLTVLAITTAAVSTSPVVLATARVMVLAVLSFLSVPFLVLTLGREQVEVDLYGPEPAGVARWLDSELSGKVDATLRESAPMVDPA